MGGSVQATKLATNVFSTDNNTDLFAAITGSDFAYSGSTDFTLTASSCVLTYNGTSGRSFLVILTVGLETSTGVISAVACAVDKNGDLLGTAVATDASTAAGAIIGYSPALNANAVIASQRRVTLNNGDTLQPVGGKFTAANFDLTIDALTMSVIPQ